MKKLIQFRNLSKRILLPVIPFFISLGASAQQQCHKPVAESKTIELTEAFNRIEVIGDARIILTNNLEEQLVFRGNPKNVREAKARIKNGRLIISTGWKKASSDFTVFVPVSHIRSLVTSGKTKILSSGTVKIQDLEILVNGSSTVSVNYDGKLKVIPGSGYELIYGNN